MGNQQRATQSDVARRAGVERSTVSLALRGSPRIPEATRKKICSAAKQLGYQPDPMLSALAAYRTSRRKKSFHGTLGWLVNDVPGFTWNAVSMYEETFLGGKERAGSHGYTLEVFKLRQDGLNPARAAAILQARNISGLLVCPQPRDMAGFEFPWAHFSAVTFGYGLATPLLHTVTTAHMRDMIHTLRRMRSLGYRRIGLIYSQWADSRVAHNYLAGFLTDQHLSAGTGAGIPPIDPDCENLGPWLRRHRPDAIVSAGLGDIEARLKGLGIIPGADVGLAVLPVASRTATTAGMYENAGHMGSFAVDLLVGMLQQGMRGESALPHYTLVDSEWREGATLPPRPPGRKARPSPV